MNALMSRNTILLCVMSALALICCLPAAGLIEDVMTDVNRADTTAPNDTTAQCVVVRGESADSDAAARQQVLKKAVEQVCGVYVLPEARGKNYTQTMEEIYTKSAGLAQVQDVIDSGEVRGVHWVIAKVCVSQRPLMEMLKAGGLLRQWRIAVLIPETHILRPRIVDPAAETALIRELTDAGFRVVDRDVSERYRYDDVVMAAWRGDTPALKLLLKKCKADILVVGEAFSQRPERDADELRANGMVSCRARVEIRAVVKATNETLTADSEHAAGIDLTEELAGKVALENAARQIGQRLAEKIAVLPASTTAWVALMVAGLDSLSEGDTVQGAVSKLPGVRRVNRDEFSKGTLYLQVEVDNSLVQSLAGRLEKLKPIKLRVEKASKASIRAVAASSIHRFGQ